MAGALAREPDARRRARLEDERCRVIEASLVPIAVPLTEARHAAARSLGWPSYAAMYGELTGIDLPDLHAQAVRFLAATDDDFAAIVAPPVRDTLGLELDELRRADLPRLLRAPALDEHFPPDGLAAALTRTLAGLGIDLAAQRNVVLDLAPRAAKSRRAFCAPVRVPQEIYLVLAAVGGWEDYAALLHEAGHAEHFACADPALPFESRRLSDPAVGEAFAFLLEQIADDRRGCGRTASMPRVPDPEGAPTALPAPAGCCCCAATPPSSATSSTCTAGGWPSPTPRQRTPSACLQALRVPWPCGDVARPTSTRACTSRTTSARWTLAERAARAARAGASAWSGSGPRRPAKRCGPGGGTATG